MSSKTADNTPAAMPGREWSLGKRLMVWYATSTFALVFFTSGVLYYALTRSLDSEDDTVLLNKAISIRELLREQGINSSAVRWEVESEEMHRTDNQIYVRIIGANGERIMASPGMSAKLPRELFPPPEVPTPGVSRGKAVRSPHNGRPYRLFSAKFADTLPTDPEVIHVGLDTEMEQELLQGYRNWIWAVLSTALLASCAGGWYIAKQGTQPIEKIAETTQKIRSSTLYERINTEGLPKELKALAVTFNQMLERLEGAFARISQFSADIAHELRTPINNLRGEAEVLLSRSRTEPEYRENLSSCLEECSRLSRLIEGLLFLARAEQPETTLRREKFEIGQELEAVEAFYEAVASEAGVKLETVTSGKLFADLDRMLFQRAIGNLVENAIAHTAPGGTVTIGATRTNGEIKIDVEDTGCGIPPEHLPRIFDRFHRVDGSRSRHKGGMGLGLAIVKSVAALHGGEVEVTSTLDAGTRVRMSVPSVPEA